MRIPVLALKINHSIVGRINFLCMVEQWGFRYGGECCLFNSKKRYNTFLYITKNTQYAGNRIINIIVGMAFNFYIIIVG